MHKAKKRRAVRIVTFCLEATKLWQTQWKTQLLKCGVKPAQLLPPLLTRPRLIIAFTQATFTRFDSHMAHSIPLMALFSLDTAQLFTDITDWRRADKWSKKRENLRELRSRNTTPPSAENQCIRRSCLFTRSEDKDIGRE